MQQPKLTWTPNPALEHYGVLPPVTYQICADLAAKSSQIGNFGRNDRI